MSPMSPVMLAPAGPGVRRARALLVLVAALLSGCGVVTPVNTPGTAPPPLVSVSTAIPTRAGSSPVPASSVKLESGWIVYNAPDGSFSIAFPRQPDETSQADAQGNTDHLLSVDQVYTRFTTEYADFQPNTVDTSDLPAFLDKLVTGEVARSNGTITSSRGLTLDGHPGRAFEASGGGDIIVGRVFLVGDRLYYLHTVTYQENYAAETGRVQDFLDSFQLAIRDVTPEPTAAAAGPVATGSFGASHVIHDPATGVELGVVRVLKVTKYFSVTADNKQVQTPAAGEIFVGVEVAYDAHSQFPYIGVDWEAHDESGNTPYEWIDADLTPRLGAGTLQPGQHAEGWTSFDVPLSSAHLWIDFLQAGGTTAFEEQLY